MILCPYAVQGVLANPAYAKHSMALVAIDYARISIDEQDLEKNINGYYDEDDEVEGEAGAIASYLATLVTCKEDKCGRYSLCNQA